MYRLLTGFAAVMALAAPSGAQQFQRRALISGGGDHGKCTIEVEVDGIAEVEIRGDQGTIRNLAGNPAQWRRFQCNAPLPRNPADFRFQGIDGRGRQDLIRDPRNGGVAVVRIEDSKGGSEGYTFDLIWGGDYGSGGPRPGSGGGVIYPDRPPHRFTADQAVRLCEDSVNREARNRFRGNRVAFLSTRIDDNPGRNDWVVGTIEVSHGRVDSRYHFSCSVNFDSGQVRSVDIDSRAMDHGGPDRPSGAARALQTCESAVQDRARRNGYDRVDFQSIRMDDSPGRNDWVIGSMRASRGRGTDAFGFSCSVDLRSGEVRSVDLTRR